MVFVFTSLKAECIGIRIAQQHVLPTQNKWMRVDAICERTCMGVSSVRKPRTLRADVIKSLKLRVSVEAWLCARSVWWLFGTHCFCWVRSHEPNLAILSQECSGSHVRERDSGPQHKTHLTSFSSSVFNNQISVLLAMQAEAYRSQTRNTRYVLFARMPLDQIRRANLLSFCHPNAGFKKNWKVASTRGFRGSIHADR